MSTTVIAPRIPLSMRSGVTEGSGLQAIITSQAENSSRRFHTALTMRSRKSGRVLIPGARVASAPAFFRDAVKYRALTMHPESLPRPERTSIRSGLASTSVLRAALLNQKFDKSPGHTGISGEGRPYGALGCAQALPPVH